MTEDTLYRLGSDASLLVTEDLMTGDVAEYSETKLEEYRVDTGLTADLSAVNRVIDYVIAQDSPFDPGDHEIDAAVAPAIRKYIDIPLRDAGDPRIWHYLAIGWRPDFVRYRWPWSGGNRTVTSMTEKFLGSTQNLYSNAFSRLWFMAEFTRDGDDYTETEALLKTAFKSNRLFDRMDLRRQRTGQKLTKVANQEPDTDVVEKTAKAVSHQWSVTSEEHLSEGQLGEVIEAIYREKK